MTRVLHDIGGELLTPSFDVKYIVPYPYSSNIGIADGEPVPYLSKLSEISMDAATEVWDANPQARIVLLGENCYPGLPDTTDLMMQRGRAGGINEDVFVPIHQLPDGRNLNNTYLQTEGLGNYFDRLSEEEVEGTVVSALGYHLERVANAVRAYKHLRAVKFASAEAIRHAAGDHSFDEYLPTIDSLGRSSQDKAVKLLTATVDRRGRIPNLLVKLGGPRQVDAVKDPETGEIKLENSSARKKLQTVMTQADGQANARAHNN